MGVEIERKYLIHKEKWSTINKGHGIFYQQGYLLVEQNKTIRIRLTEKSGFITIKGKTNGLQRLEYEFEISKQDACDLLDKFCTSFISKIRYKVYYQGQLWEIDEFLDKNEGLLLAEIEIKEESEKFILPDWVAKEVTYDERFYNAYLSLHPYKYWDKKE